MASALRFSVQATLKYPFGANPRYLPPKIKELQEQIRPHIPDGLVLKERAIIHKGKRLEFYSVKISEDGDLETIHDYDASLKVLETALPEVLLKEMGPRIGKVLEFACLRTWAFLHAWAETENEDPHRFLEALLEDAHGNPSFKPIQNFSGNVGPSYAAIEKVVKEGNVRERMFFLINIVRNILKPEIEQKDKENVLEEFFSLLKEKLEWNIEGFELKDGSYFSFSNDAKIRVADPKKWPKPTVAEVKASSCSLIPFSEAEIAYIVSKVKEEDVDQAPVYFGSAAEKFRSKQAYEDPANPYLKAVAAAHLPTTCSISGVTSDIFELCTKFLGLNNDEAFKRDLRLACLASILEAKNHSVVEVAHAAMAYGVGFVCSPEYYMHLVEGEDNGSFIEALRARMEELGHGLPHEILLRGAAPQADSDDEKEA